MFAPLLGRPGQIAFLLLSSVSPIEGAPVAKHPQPALRGNENEIVSKTSRDNSGPSCAALTNRGTFSTLEIAVGTPAQVFSVVADTGSDSVIIPSCICKENGGCAEANRCFTGTGVSSSFNIENGPDGPPGAVITFGSGPIEVAIGSDVVRVGQVESVMDDAVMLMIDQNLDFGGFFEGIIGLGLPADMRPPMEARVEPTVEDSLDVSDLDEITLQDIIQGIMADAAGDAVQGEDAAAANGYLVEVGNFPDNEVRPSPIQGSSLLQSRSKIHSRAKLVDDEEEAGLVAIHHSPTNSANRTSSKIKIDLDEETGFLERAGVSRFSMCFNDGDDGALRLNPPQAEHTFGNVGREHWAVDMRGISVGANASRLAFCGTEGMKEGQQTPCGGIPDSGTTVIMAPQEHLDTLFESLCDGWDRCRQNHTAMVEAARAASSAAKGMYGLDPFGIMPSPKKDIFKLLLADCDSWLESSETGLEELPPLRFAIRDGAEGGEERELEMPAWSYTIDSGAQADGTARICDAAFSAMEYETELNGPVWIFGTPFFYMFEIGYDMTTTSPGISFTSLEGSTCGTCGAEGAAALVSHDAESTKARRQKQPRRETGQRRYPSFDTRRPL